MQTIDVEKLEETPAEVKIEMPTVDEMLSTDAYMQSTLANIQANQEMGLYDKDNVYSLHGLFKDIRSTYESVVLINPGTSIEDKLDELRSLNREKVAVICSDICLPGLVSAGVPVSYVVTLDPNIKTACFIQGISLKGIGVIASSASPIHKYFTEDTEFYLYNSMEETSDFIMRMSDADASNPNSVFGTALILEKSRRINEYLRDAGILRKFTQLLARGTVAVTLFQVAREVRLPSTFYGFDFYIRNEKPYAEFIAKAVYDKLLLDKTVAPAYQFEDYKKQVVLSYYEGKQDQELMNKTKYDHPELGMVYVPPLLYLYKELFLRYINLVGASGKNMKFV